MKHKIPKPRRGSKTLKHVGDFRLVEILAWKDGTVAVKADGKTMLIIDRAREIVVFNHAKVTE